MWRQQKQSDGQVYKVIPVSAGPLVMVTSTWQYTVRQVFNGQQTY